MAPEILDKKWFQVDDPATVSLKNAKTCIQHITKDVYYPS